MDSTLLHNTEEGFSFSNNDLRLTTFHIVVQLCIILKILSQNAIAHALYSKTKIYQNIDRYVMLGIVVILFLMI